MRILQAIIITALMFAQGSASAQCLGDANGNGFVNFADYGAVAQNFGKSCSPEARFVDNGDGTITDSWTQLMWGKKVKLDSAVDLANSHDADNVYNWSGTCALGGELCQPDAAAEAACLANVEGSNLGCAQCVSGLCNVGSPGGTVWQWVVALNIASFGGHSDWQVPTRLELESIVDFADMTPPVVNVAFHGASCGVACADLTDPACACTKINYYWSRSTYATSTDVAWLVYFSDGYLFATSKPNDGYIRAVRGSS